MKKAFEDQIGEDYAASRGEYLNGKVLAHYLEFQFIDPKDVILLMNMGIMILKRQILFYLLP